VDLTEAPTVKVYIAVGHGRRPNGTYDPGATAGKATEQNQGDPIVQAAAKRLRDLGVTVRAQRAGDANFVGYTREANEWDADLAVSVHHDWSGAPRGAFGFWYPGSTQGKRLADAIYRSVEAAGFPMRPSWHKSHSRLYFLNNTRMPAVLWECDRVGQVTDHVRYGRALADGIARYLGIALNPPPATSVEDNMFTKIDGKDTVYAVRKELGGTFLIPVSRPEMEGYSRVIDGKGWNGRDHVGNLTSRQVRDAGFTVVG
jgi:hypothetical protein